MIAAPTANSTQLRDWLKTANPEQITQEQLDAAWALADADNLYHLCRNTLGYDRFTPEPHQNVCDFLTNKGKYTGRLTNKRKLLLVPRGCYKTTAGSQGLPIQLLLNDPNIRILLDGETYELSKARLRTIKGLITTRSLFRRLHGGWERPMSDEAKAFARANHGTLPWNEDEIYIGARTDFSKQQASISCSGIDVAKTGQHYDFIIGDDYHSEKNISTKEQIQKVIQHLQTFEPIMDPGCGLIIIGTRWAEGDAYGWIIEDLEGVRINEPGIYQGQDWDIMVYPWRWGTEPNRRYFAPAIWNEDTIQSMKRTCEKSPIPGLFAAWMENDPVSPENAVFLWDWLEPNILTREQVDALLPGAAVISSIDPALTEDKSSDFSAMVTCAFTSRVIERPDGRPDWQEMQIILDCHHGRWVPERLIEEVFATAKKWNPLQIGFEAVSAFKVYEALFRRESVRRQRNLPIVYFPRDNRVSKPVRIEALAPIFKSGIVYILKDCRGFQEFKDEYTRYRRGRASRHDDVLDALADVQQFGYYPQGGEEQEEPYEPLDRETGY